MKITSDRSYLAAAVKQAMRGATGYTNLPCLKCVHIETGDGKIIFTATNLDNAVRTNIPGCIHTPGTVCVPGAPLADLLAAMPNAPVTIEANGNKLEIRSGELEYDLLSLPVEDYPVIPEFAPDFTFKVPQSRLKEMLGLTTAFASRKETRSILMGVLLSTQGDDFSLVSTDTHRLAKIDGPICHRAIEDDEKRQANVPAAFLKEVHRFLKPKNAELIEIQFCETKVLFVTPDVTFIARRLEGQYPDFTKVIPSAPERKFTFTVESLMAALKRVNIISHANSRKVIMNLSGESARLGAESYDVGKAREQLKITSEGEPLDIAFNCSYLAQVLKLSGAERVTLELCGALNPGILRIVGRTDFLYVLMPMQV